MHLEGGVDGLSTSPSSHSVENTETAFHFLRTGQRLIESRKGHRQVPGVWSAIRKPSCTLSPPKFLENEVPNNCGGFLKLQTDPLLNTPDLGWGGSARRCQLRKRRTFISRCCHCCACGTYFL
jgi:hypothetical protein